MSNLIKRKIVPLLLSLVMMSSLHPAYADTLNFLEWQAAGVTEFWTGETELSLSNADVRTYGSNIYYSGAGGFLEDNNLGTVGPCTTGNCIGDLEITFKHAINGLTFDAVAVGDDDIIKISAFNGSTKVGEIDIRDIKFTFAYFLDFSAFGNITRLFFDDLGSDDSGVLYNDFNFETAGISAVPLPAGLPLFATALVGFGFFGWRKRRAS